MRRRRKAGRKAVKAQRRNAPKATRPRSEKADTRLTAELKEAREHQAATAEVLQVIRNSRTNIQPAFDAIVRVGARLFQDSAVAIAIPDGGMIKAISIADSNPERAEAWRRVFPVPLTREYVTGVAILDHRIVDIPDVQKASKEQTAGRRNFVTLGYRGVTVVPLMRDEEAIGALCVIRVAPGSLTKSQVFY